VTETTTNTSPTRSWWLALAALVICAPWPGLEPRIGLLGAVVALLILLARPSGAGRWPWLGVVLAVAGAMAPVATTPEPERLAADFDGHCREMLSTAGAIVGDDGLNRLFATTGEALNPTRPFEFLHGVARQTEGRTIYLADDRGQLLAWGGVERDFPIDLRSLGPRAWGIEWSASRGVLHLREPMMIEGRIVGSVTVADRAERRGGTAWGMRAPRGYRLILGRFGSDAVSVTSEVAPGAEVHVAFEGVAAVERRGLFSVGWLVVVICGLLAAPRAAWAAVLLGLAIAARTPVGLSGAEQMILILLGGAAVGRLGRELPGPWARLLVVVTVFAGAVVRLAGPLSGLESWLPNHLLRPGWGGVWMVALAWVLSGWPGLAGRSFPLERRVLAAGCLALVGLVVDLAWYPAQILDAGPGGTGGVVLPRSTIAAEEVLPDAAGRCRLDDLATVLARRWGLDGWSTPSRLTVVSADDLELSSWGDLSPAGDRQRLVRAWPLGGADGIRVELDVATEPWNWLADWASGDPLGDAWQRPVWYAVLTRSGSVAATLHPEISGLDPAVAGEAYHSGAVWTGIRVGDGGALARVQRRGDWLVAAVAHPPAPPVWVVRIALAVVWAFIGLVLARPPVVRREQFATFGGRLRLLVAGGVVIPLVILTLFLQLRLGREEARLEEVIGRDAFEAARYTIEHLGGGVVVDDQLAAWLARGWGGEVVFFDRTAAVAVSRPDLYSVGRLSQLPAVEAFPAYLLGRTDTVVLRRPKWVTSAGAVAVEGTRVILQLYRADPLRAGEAPDAVDWLLTGALLAALIALIATGRIEERLSVSLRELVDLAGRLVRGEPVGPVRRPRETDLAEVLDAVRSMNEEVRRRELSLRHQEELLRITLANLSPAVMVFEPDGNLKFTNPSAQALLDENAKLVHEQVRKLAADMSDSAEVGITLQPIPGRDLTWRIGLAKVPLPDGRSGLVAVIDDVTEVVRLDRLQQLNQLARIVAHEVKNPLTPVRLWVQELDQARRRQDPGLDGLLEEACREIAVQVDRLQDTAISFSNLVALEHWQPVPVDLSDAVRELTEGLGVLDRRGIVVTRNLPAPASATVMADRQWLKRALANLLQNSLDALAGGPGEILLTVTAGGGQGVMEIEDSGGGVPSGQLQDLFSPHFSTTASGSGLGLALVRQVVTRCHGRVEAENGARGLRIRIELPLA
jgi:signal transduction histidine kinase